MDDIKLVNRTSNESQTTVAENWEYPPIYYEKIQHSVNLIRVLAPVIILVGTVGNVLSIVVMQRRDFRTTTTSLYIRVLSVVDTACLYVGLVHTWIRHGFGYDFRDASEVTCRTQRYLLYSLVQVEAWLLVSVSLERLVAIYHPTKVKVWFSKQRAVLTMVILVVSVAVLNLHLLLFHLHVRGDIGRITCDLEQNSPSWKFNYFIYPYMGMLVASGLPITSIFICNAAIIVKMATLKKRKRAMQSSRQSDGDSNVTSMTRMLVAACAVFFITTLPSTVGNALYWPWFYDAWERRDVQALANLETAHIILYLLWYCNFAVNFFTYVVGGARFRRELSAMCCKQRRRGRKVEANVTVVTVSD